MFSASDFQIFQRDGRGVAEVPFAGTVPEFVRNAAHVFARAVREDDNIEVAPWTECAKEGDRWSVRFTLPEGGLYRLEAHASEQPNGYHEWSARVKSVRHIGVGELFLLTGQSNMAGYGRDMAYDPPTLGVHLYANNGRWSVAAHPLNDSTDTIYPENTEHTSGTSPALAFGRTLSKRLGVPVGLVQASLGGSGLNQWHPEEDANLYRGMMRRMDAVGRVGGVIWYQGCNEANAEKAEGYCDRFVRMIELWRRELGEIPVVTVQLGKWVGPNAPENADLPWWGILREAQRQAARRVRDLYVVPANDGSLSDGIHNSSASNVVIGERMASALLKAHYGLPGLLAPDVLGARRVDDTHVALEFAPEFLVAPMDSSAAGFDVEDADGLVACVSACAKDGGLLLETARPFSLPARAHGLWRQMTPATQPRDYRGMPVLSFYGVSVEP